MIVAPSAAPVNIHTEAQNSTQIKVLWDPPPPETHNGDLSGYKVFFFTIFIIEILLKVALNTKTRIKYFLTIKVNFTVHQLS
jgi:hypothetical protein